MSRIHLKSVCWAVTAAGLAGLLASPAVAEPYFKIQTPEEWLEALNGDPPHVMPLPLPEGIEYLENWGMYLLEGEPYPEAEFRPAELYVYSGGGDPYPEEPGLVMSWGGEQASLPPGNYASAWKFDYGLDPDLSNALVDLTVFPPQWGPSGQITTISFGIRDVNGKIRSWQWNVGPGTSIPWDAVTQLTIHCSQTGLAATSPPANGYMSQPLFDIAQAQSFIADENAAWVGGPLPVPPPGGPPQGLWNYWHDIVVRPESQVKWSQPPDPAHPDNVFLGWNEYSEWCFGPIAADDWVCTSDAPITEIHWWGSFLGWRQDVPPVLPSHFHLQVWTDVPAQPGGFSHPGQVIWEVTCFNYTVEFAGWDYDPRMREYEAAFLFKQILNPPEYFYQQGGANIYWLSIAACYDCVPPGEFPFGVKTRPHDPNSAAPDDAVVITDPAAPGIGAQYVNGFPLFFPTPEQSWDLAFELVAGGTELAKWLQPPDLRPFLGIDVNASRSPLGPPYILADDFLCTATGPVTQIVVYGSWYHDFVPDPNSVLFRLSFHSDVPATPIEPSHPGELLWLGDFPPGSYSAEPIAQSQEGWLNPPDGYEPFADTLCWRYSFPMPAGAFFQEGTPENPVIYWLDVQADVPFTDAFFGWKTSIEHWNDDAVWGIGQEPYFGPWGELRYPPGHEFAGDSIDLAFEIFGQGLGALKWSQPPQPYDPPDAFNGWDEYSMYGMYQIAADDWLCTTADPVSDIHWWGSFIGWSHMWVPPQGMPPRFHIAIWTDVPADPADPTSFSHPGAVIWENYCDTYNWQFVGWDFDPRTPDITRPPEATFRFTQDLPAEAWFWQEPGPNIYWISIAAIYDGVQPEYPWGWKTRPRDAASPAPDDAVYIFDPTAPVIGAQYINGGPLWYPTPADSWDLAFELTTQPQPPRDVVVCEPQGGVNPVHPPTYWYDLTPGGAFGRCDFHVQVLDPNPANYTNVVVPPTWLFSVHLAPDGNWWASWWDPDCDNAIWPGTTFRFQFDHPGPHMWGDWTTTISSTNDPNNQVVDRSANHVGEPNGLGYLVHVPTPQPEYPKWEQPPTEHPQHPGFFYGWNEPALYWGPQFVADDWYCLDPRPISDIHWWGSYLGWQEPNPPPGPLAFQLGIWTDVPAGPDTPWSHPGMLIREWFVQLGELGEHFVGLDFHPEHGMEACFQYDFLLPPEDWFYQEPGADRIYWLSIAAVYGTACNADFDGDGDVDQNDVDFFASCMLLPPPPGCWRADLNGDGLVNLLDATILQCQFAAGWPDPACCNFPSPPPEWVWGWKTRQPHWNDDAVRTFAPIPPRLLQHFEAGLPIETPDGLSWDMAFLLTSPEPPTVQACCRPDGTCIDLFPENCVRIHNGTPMGLGTTCATLAPFVTVDPADAEICPTTTLELRVVVCGAAPLTYDWRKDGASLGAPSSPLLVVPAFGDGDVGLYDVVVSNAFGTATSAGANVTLGTGIKGDANCDGAVNALDINPFVIGLVDMPRWIREHPDCDWECCLDVNCDGAINALDISPFVRILTGWGACCLPDGTCAMSTNQAACQATTGAIWLGAGTNCACHAAQCP